MDLFVSEFFTCTDLSEAKEKSSETISFPFQVKNWFLD